MLERFGCRPSDDTIDIVEHPRRPWFRFPIFIDLVHNNARSRAILVLLFAFVTAIVTFYFTSTIFAQATQSTVKITFSASPPISATFGAKFVNFSALVVNQWGIGISGVEVAVTMTPLSTFEIGGRVIDCVAHFLSATSSTASEDRLLCDPSRVPGALVNATAVTDGDGIAAFSDFRFTFGHPMTYALVATHNRKQSMGDVNKNHVEASVSMRSPVTSIIADGAQLPRSVDIGSAHRITAELRLSEPVSSSDPLGSFLGLGDSSGAAPAAIASDAALIDTFSRLQCAVLSHAVAGAASETFLFLSENIENVDNVTLDSVSTSVDGARLPAFRGAVAFEALRISGMLGTSAAPRRLVLWCLGATAIIGANAPVAVNAAFRAAATTTGDSPAHQTPSQRAWAFFVSSNITRVVVAATLSAEPAAMMTVIEGRALPTLAVRLTEGGAAPQLPARNRHCVATATLESLPAVQLHAGSAAKPKSLLNAVSNASDLSGVAIFDSLVFTRNGAVGRYRVRVTCDGIETSTVLNTTVVPPNDWTGAGGGAAVSTSSIVVDVLSSVSPAIVVYDALPVWIPNADAQRAVTLGEQWPVSLSARVFDRITTEPVAGKRATISASWFNATTNVTVSFDVAHESTESDLRGFIRLNRVRVLAANMTGPVTLRNVAFAITVDGIVADTSIFRDVVVPVALPAVLSTTCSALRLGAPLSTPRIIAGNPLDTLVAVVATDSRRRPMGGAQILVRLAPTPATSARNCPRLVDLTSPLAAASECSQNATGIALISSDGSSSGAVGHVNLSTLAIDGVGWVSGSDVVVTLEMWCAGSEASTAVPLRIPLVVSPRFRSASLVSATMDAATLSVGLIVGGATAGALPSGRVVAVLQPIWQPRDFVDCFPAIALTPAPVVGTETTSAAAATLTIQFPVRPASGVFVFRVVIDGDESAALHAVLSIDAGVRSVSLLRGISAAPALRMYTAFSQQPQVALLGVGGIAVSAPVYAKLLLVESSTVVNGNSSTTTTSTRVLDPLSNADDFELGMLANFASGTSTAPLSPSADPATGIATFADLGLLGLHPKSTHAFRLRYCVSPTVFVDDPTLLTSSMIVAAGSPPIVQLLSVPNLYAVPGKALTMPLLGTVVRPATVLFPIATPVLGAAVRLAVVNSTAASLITSQREPLPLARSPSSSFGVVTVDDYAFSTTTPVGFYQLQMIAPGGRSVASSVVAVTRSAFSIELIEAPSPNLLVGSAVSDVVVRVKVPDGQGLPGAWVRASLLSSNETCIAQGCGVIQSRSALAVTNASGIAVFDSLLIESGAAGRYKLRFAVEGSSSSVVDKLNGFIGGLSQLAFGATFVSSSTVNLLSSQPGAASLLSSVGAATGAASTSSSGTVESAAAAASTAAAMPAFLSARIKEEQSSSLLLSLAASAAYRRLKASSEIALETDSVTVFNTVHNVTIVRQPTLALSGFSQVTNFDQQPELRILDAAGRPIANKSVTISAFPSTIDLTFSEQTTTSDANGVLRFTDLRIVNVAPDSYQLVFLVDGVSSSRSSSFTVGAQDVSQSTLVQIIALVVLIVLAPLFFAAVPYARVEYFVASFAVLVVVPLVTYEWALVNVIENDNIFMRLHTSLISLIWIAVTLSLLFQYLYQFLSKRFWFMRIYDGETRAMHAYRYTKWLISARRPQLSQAEWERRIEAERLSSIPGRIETALEKAFPNKIETIDRLFGDNKDIDIYELKRFQPPPLEVPSNIQAVWFPNRFLIVLSITVIMMIVAGFLAVHIIWSIIGWLDEVRGMLPKPPDATPEEKQRINAELQSAVIVGFNLIADANAQLAFLKNLEGAVLKFNIFKTWETAFVLISDIRTVVESAGFFGLACGTLAVIFTWVTLCFAVNRIMWQIRRGELRHMKSNCSLLVADRYTGLHVFHFVITFLSVFFIGFVIAIIVASRELLLFIVSEFWLTILTSLVSVILTTIAEVLVVGRWWVFGLTIHLIYPYMLWTIFAVILSLVNGVMQTIVRWFKAIFAITVLFARLDLDMFPQALLFLDSGYWSFHSMLFVDEEYNNPLFLSAVGIFLTEMLLKREFDRNVQTPIEHFGVGTITLPNVLNVTRLHLRDRCGEVLSLRDAPQCPHYPWDLHLLDAKSRKRRRAASRWRLIVFLTMNPSLIKMRKHRLIAAAVAAAKSSALSGADAIMTTRAYELSPSALREQERRRRASSIADDAVGGMSVFHGAMMMGDGGGASGGGNNGNVARDIDLESV